MKPEATPGCGKLFVVATPLGNLADLSPRARSALEAAHVIAAEDTRRTGLLLQKLALPKKEMVALFGPREAARAPGVVRRIAEGLVVALVTDGGTPGISDPGAGLVRLVHEAGFPIEPIPGPTAVGLILSVSSLAGGPFVFEGFLPSTRGARRARITELSRDPRPVVFFEAPHRIRETAFDLVELFGHMRKMTWIREGTKIHEEVGEGNIGEFLERLAPSPRGEFTLLVEGNPTPAATVPATPDQLVDLARSFDVSLDFAVRRVSEVFGLPRSRLLRESRARLGTSPETEAGSENTRNSEKPSPDDADTFET